MNESLQAPGEYHSRGSNLEQIIDQLPHLSQLVQKVAQNPHANIEAKAELDKVEKNAPKVDAITMAMLGVPVADIKMDSMRRAPTKEGKPNISEQYQVADRDDGEAAFLKLAPGINGRSKVSDLAMLSFAQDEVFASRIAQSVGYPMPPTKLVRIENEAWLMSDYHAGTDHSPSLGRSYGGCIANPNAFESRIIFDALIGSQWAGPREGIVDQATSQYFAIDAHMVLNTDDRQVTSAEMQERLSVLNDSQPFSFTANMSEIIQSTRTALESGAFRNVCHDVIGPDETEQRLVEGIEARARALVDLYDTQSNENHHSGKNVFGSNLHPEPRRHSLVQPQPPG